jgi:hypothetical protein
MKSTLAGTVPPYISADLTDRYSIPCRAIDVCGLMPAANGSLKASFWDEVVEGAVRHQGSLHACGP